LEVLDALPLWGACGGFIMFKKLFDKIVDICKPGIDDPTCQFGGSTANTDRKTMSAHTDNQPETVGKKEKAPTVTLK
jgi:hypothetical protein